MPRLTRRLPALREEKEYIRNEMLTWPNAVTLVRLVCALVMLAWVTLKWQDGLLWMFWLALTGAVSDIIDGWLAKRFKLGTEFGKRFDQYTDWLFGIAVMAVIVRAGGIVWDAPPYNGELLVLIGGYLAWRLKYPKVETTLVAKIKTAMQFGGGVMIIAAHAHAPELFLHEDDYDKLALTFGYQLVWVSVGVMLMSGIEYRKQKIDSKR